ncbi:hypothetical protein BH20ACT11_BH20ACT11_11280 [soil metagenome]
MAQALIREIAENHERPLTGEEVQRVVECVSSAPFDPEPRRVATALRGLFYQGHELGTREQPLRSHLVQRVLIDRQWADGTVAHEYLEDLRAAARHPSAKIAVGLPPGSGPLVYLFAPNATPPGRLGENSLPWVFVLYSTDADAIITGYQASGMETVRLPSNTRWLR